MATGLPARLRLPLPRRGPLAWLKPVALEVTAVPGRDGEPLEVRPPILGALAVIFGVTALDHATLVLAPLALLISLVAAFRRQFAWAAIGAISAVAALVTSTWFWSLLGLSMLAGYLL
jgi:hypothetical protein